MSVTSLLRDDPTIASRYLADQLSDSERQSFEVRLIEDPAVLRELEATARMKMGLRELRREGHLDNLVENRNKGSLWAFGIAAAVAVLAIGLGVWRPDAPKSAMIAASVTALVDDSGHPLRVAGSYAVLRKRADAYDATIALPAERRAIELRILPGAVAPGNSYQITLAQIDGRIPARVIGAVEMLQPAANGEITVYVDSSVLMPGEYELNVMDATGRPIEEPQENLVILTRQFDE
jgi:hypothetical protein